MLAAHSMGSHGGQQNFPFGYIPNELHGIGLPDFMTPGPPPGQPLLTEHDSHALESFFDDFDTSGTGGKVGSVSMQQPPNGMTQHQGWMMPPTFVGSETMLRARPNVEWPHNQMSDFTYNHDLALTQMPQATGFNNGNNNNNNNGHSSNFNNHDQYHLVNQMHSAAQTVPSAYAPGWQQGLPNQHVAQVQQSRGNLMRFGSDSHFQPTGYSAPPGHYDRPVTDNLDWLEVHNSTPNTQPNTRPNTQPSSPNWSKKRKLSSYEEDSRRNGISLSTNGQGTNTGCSSPNSRSKRQKKQFAKQERHSRTSQPPTPVSVKPVNPLQGTEEDAEEDADYDEEEEDEDTRRRSPSPAPWPSNKPRPPKSNKSPIPPKSGRGRKKSTTSNPQIKSKAKPSRSSIGGTPSSRTPLTADQKKANHTNSEQRRRDATARAYADLYDLVPELDEIGKQSTMKRLELVVEKVAKVKNRVAQLRGMLGMHAESSNNDMLQPIGPSFMNAATTGVNVGNFPAADLRAWQQR